MAIKPGSSPITFTLAASSINALIVADDISYTVNTQKFQRKEFSNVFLASLPESDGSEVVKQINVTGKPVQINFNCGVSNLRNFAPDDLNINQILQRFTIKKYTVKGAPSSPSAVDSLFTVAQDHARKYSVFEGYLDLFTQRLSYSYFSNLISQTFAYLTATGLNATGEGWSENNLLIKNFNEGIQHLNPTSGVIVTKDWGLEFWVIKFIDSELAF